MFGKTEDLVIVLLIILLLFGSRKIPQLAKSIGQAAREVRKGFSGDVNDSSDAKSEAAKKSETEDS